MTTCLAIQNATHWADTRSIERISCYIQGFVAGCKLLVVTNGLVVVGRRVATDSRLHFIEVAECRVWIVRRGPVVD